MKSNDASSLMNEKIIIEYLQSSTFKDRLDIFLKDNLLQTFKEELVEDICNKTSIQVNFDLEKLKCVKENINFENDFKFQNIEIIKVLDKDFDLKNEEELIIGLGLYKKAIIKVEYLDGVIESKIWNSEKSMTSEEVIKNLNLRPEFKKESWAKAGILNVSFILGDNNKIENITKKTKPMDNSVLKIVLEPNDEYEFKKQLLISKSANIEIFYNDNRSEVKKWKANRFKDSSSVIGNLRSRLEFRNGNWQERNISYVKVYIGDYKQNENRVPIMTNKKREVN